jgi:hypothetical protein
VELNAGHLSLVSHPKEIADLILAAAFDLIDRGVQIL